MKLLLMTLSLFSLSAMAGSEWSCKQLPVSENISYKAVCNVNKTITFSKIRFNFESGNYRLEDSLAFCNLFGLETFNDVQFTYHVFKRKVLRLGEIDGKLVTYVEKKSRSVDRITCYDTASSTVSSSAPVSIPEPIVLSGEPAAAIPEYLD